MSEPSLPDKIEAIHDRLVKGRIPHAFGGALALAYYAEPRSTIDIDLNLFVPPGDYAKVRDALAPLSFDTQTDLVALERDGQCRLRWGRTPLDLFFAYDEFHRAMRDRTRTVPFGEGKLPVLAPEDLVICKAVFNRPKDWLDIEQVLICVEHLDLREIERWLGRIVGSDDPRAERFKQAAKSLLDGPS